MDDLLADVQKVDDNTVKFKRKASQVAFLSMLAMDWAAIESKEYADDMVKAGTLDKIDQEPVGTGPFILVKYDKDATIRYKANPDYFRGKQKIQNLVFAITKDATVRKAKLEAGECDVAYSPSPVDLPAIKANPKLEVLSGAGMNVGYLAFNTMKKPFDDKRVRQALSMAIDRKAILKDVFQGNGQLADTPLPTSLWGHDKDVKAYPYDPEKAKALLKEAGVTDLQTDLWYQPVTRPYNPDGKKMGEMMQADLAKVGVKVNLVTFEWGEYRKRAGQGEHTMMQMGWIADYPDPDDFLFPLLTCTAQKGNANFAQWCNKDFDDVVMKAQQTTDLKERTAYYAKAQEIVHEEAPWMTTGYANFNIALKKSVTGYKLDPILGLQNFDGVGKSE
jgi:dipeptide transport system substrate-binding protein